jgi:FKBP-type peptidyl-prolyl cis-trans isomerase (trigger factor)
MQEELNREREENEKLKEKYHKVIEDKEQLLIDFKAKSDLCTKL